MSFWKNRNQYSWLWGTIAGLLFLGIGASQGQLTVIWKKAVMICLECIGIG
ncbi:MAG: CD1871A family CXXC motif-containing protein [Lachnospiraceae bacterium]|nr:CD1871A family CXXC motif-containing protein [Lachnospiraceae bacterium]